MATPPDWAGIKRRQRGHAAGDHELCNYNRCPVKRKIEDDFRAHYDMVVVFEELAEMGIDAKTFFDVYDELGSGYEAAVELRDAEFPDWAAEDYGDEISETDRIIARSRIHECLPMDIRHAMYLEWKREHVWAWSKQEIEEAGYKCPKCGREGFDGSAWHELPNPCRCGYVWDEIRQPVD